MTKLLLIDLDGTIRAPKSGGAFIQEPTDQRPLPRAMEALNHYANEGWIISGVSNQAGVAAGHKSFEQCRDEQLYTLKLFPQIKSIHFCPDFDGKECYCCDRVSGMLCALHDRLNRPDLVGSFRKPNAGMIYAAIWGEIPQGEFPEEILFVGDRPEDEQAAKTACIPFKWADHWRGAFDDIPF